MARKLIYVNAMASKIICVGIRKSKLNLFTTKISTRFIVVGGCI